MRIVFFPGDAATTGGKNTAAESAEFAQQRRFPRQQIEFGMKGEKEPLCEMEYSKFLSLIPENKKSKYDGSHFLLAEMSEEEIRKLCL